MQNNDVFVCLVFPLRIAKACKQTILETSRFILALSPWGSMTDIHLQVTKGCSLKVVPRGRRAQFIGFQVVCDWATRTFTVPRLSDKEAASESKKLFLWQLVDDIIFRPSWRGLEFLLLASYLILWKDIMFSES